LKIKSPFRMSFPLFFFSFLGILTVSAQNQVAPTDKPFLWKIEGKKPSWLFGTIHLPDDRVLALHKVVTDALDASDAVYIEVDPAEAQGPKMQQAAMLAGNQTLRDLVPAELYGRAEKYLQTKGLPMMALEKMKVWTFAVTMMTIDYLPLMLTKQPMDVVIFTRAKENKKEAGSLETVEEQIAVFEGLTTEEQVELLRGTVDELEKGGENPVEKVIKMYLAGDVEPLFAELNQIKKTDPTSEKLMRLLFTDRDAHMAERIEAKLKANPDKSFFFAVGAGHLREKEGVVGLLAKKGLTIKRVAAQ